MSVPNLVILAVFCVKLSSGQGLVYQRSSSRSPCDLDREWIDLKIDRDHLHTGRNVCAKFCDPSSILCQVIIRTRFGIPTDGPTDRRTCQPTDRRTGQPTWAKQYTPTSLKGGIMNEQQNHDGPVSLYWLLNNYLMQLKVFDIFVQYFPLMASVNLLTTGTDQFKWFSIFLSFWHLGQN